MKLKSRDLNSSNKRMISNMLKISKQSSRELRLISRKSPLKRRKMNRKKDYSKLTKLRLEQEFRAKLSNRELEQRN